MSESANNLTLHALVIDNDARSSPARRVAAYHSDIDLVGRSQAFMEVMKQVDRAANADGPVLLTGEPGTGKALIAGAIHHRSSRADKPFVTVNCGAIPVESVEVELFGHEIGSFTGGDQDGQGSWERANGGTLFLDEITALTLSLQAKLLYALSPGEGDGADVRVIAASSRDLQDEVNTERFRSDLFHRLNAASIALPPLRERPEDIPPLAQSFADRVYSLSPAVTFSPEALALMERYSWPGNIRELENAVVRAVAICDGTIRVKDLPERVRNYTQRHGDNGAIETNGSAEKPHEEWVPLSEIEGRYVEQVLKHTGGNKQAAARVLAVDRKTLDRMIKRHHIDCEKVRRTAR